MIFLDELRDPGNFFQHFVLLLEYNTLVACFLLNNLCILTGCAMQSVRYAIGPGLHVFVERFYI